MSEEPGDFNAGYQQGSADTAEEFKGNVRSSIEDQILSLQSTINNANEAINQLKIAKQAIITTML
tara:strand:- start:181 stop:375 length:195 start_codon:yes stop_codon:yes gene_type:complete